MKEKEYLDSTIPSYYFDQRESLNAFSVVTRKWWTEMAGDYELYLSDAVLQELNSGDYPYKTKINGRLGLSTPEIVTPLELFKEEENL